MKDKRNCNNSYPIYQQPVMAPPIYPMYPSYNLGNMGINNSNITDQLNNLEQRVNSLEQRVSRLEKMNVTNNTNYSKYNDSNYYMV